MDASQHPATLILERSGQDKILNVQPTDRGGAGVGIQLQAPAAAPPPPVHSPLGRQATARPGVPRRQPPAQAPAQPARPPPPQPRAPPQPQPPRVNEEELLDTMAEFANPLKRSVNPREAAPFDEYDDEYADEDADGGSQNSEDGDGGMGGSAYGDGDEDMPEYAAGGDFQAEPEPYVEKPSEGYRTLEEEKSDIMFKLQRLQRQGVRGLRAFTPYSDIRDMRTELTRIRTELELERSIKFQRKILMAIISAMEWGNTKFNPFDLELDGWSEQMHQSVNSNTEYDGIFEELYFKYRGKVSTPPEVRLLLMVGGSAMMFHMTKAMTKSLMPNLGDMLRQNPDMMQNMMQSFSGSQQQQQPTTGSEDPGEQHRAAPGDAGTGRREMRGPGLDVGGLGGLMGGGLPGMGGISAGGLGGLMGGLGGGLARGLGGLTGGLPAPPPPPSAQLKPQPTRPDRAAPPAFAEDQSDRLSDVLSDDLASVPDDLQSVRSEASAASSQAKKVRLPAAPARRQGAKKQKVSETKKVITI